MTAPPEPSSELGPTQEGDVAPELSRTKTGNGGESTVSEEPNLESEPTREGVAFMITRAMKEQLYSQGF
jgi:hypothetical protein